MSASNALFHSLISVSNSSQSSSANTKYSWKHSWWAFVDMWLPNCLWQVQNPPFTPGRWWCTHKDRAIAWLWLWHNGFWHEDVGIEQNPRRQLSERSTGQELERCLCWNMQCLSTNCAASVNSDSLREGRGLEWGRKVTLLAFAFITICSPHPFLYSLSPLSVSSLSLLWLLLDFIFITALSLSLSLPSPPSPPPLSPSLAAVWVERHQ